MVFQTPPMTTPEYCTADFSLIPIGSKDVSFSKQVAEIQRLIQNTGLKSQMHATGTTVEGTWDQVSQTIGCAHTMIHNEGVGRIQTDIRIATRTDKIQPMEESISSVQRVLST